MPSPEFMHNMGVASILAGVVLLALGKVVKL